MTISPIDRGLISIGTIVSPFALDGRLRVRSHSGATDHWVDIPAFHIAIRNRLSHLERDKIWPQGRWAIVKFLSIDDRVDALAICSHDLWVERQFACPLSHNEYYISDLIGCNLIASSEIVGKVIGIRSASGLDLLETQLNSGKIVLIPFQEPFIGAISRESIALDTPWILADDQEID